MPTIQSSIDIAAPPAVVREKFLDFATLPTYHTTFFHSITPLGPLIPPKKIRVEFSATGQKMDAVINENTPEAFTWTGSIPLLFTGTHTFEFSPMENGTRTRFIQREVFGGLFGFLMGGRDWVGFVGKTVRGWEGFNSDFRGWCEGQGGSGL
ncbi:hypothetical protein BDW02DRAFT_645665 [Decorospora gaudefroyi]|uniref:Polyketide cyclase/dehydrase n=1 Tax=Decorospora gaudefroyi TaxID=184978 RepID=A0A6A5KTP7_9PLEO|nr:hypothetical protein BDW02DRAFT_645665 [Decorospora gaudefroyi]